MTDDLARHEARAQHGIIEFAEELKAIRDEKLYPNAGETNSGKIEPWNTYCKDRWGMSGSSVNGAIQALPVLQRRSGESLGGATPVTAASRVATLPVEVQDAILDVTTSDKDVQAKAKAVRKAQKEAEAEGREATVDEQIAAADTAKPKKVKKAKHKSKFTSLLAQAAAFIEDAADYANTQALTDIENEFAWSRLEKIELQRDRIKERLYEPDHVRNWDDEAAVLLGSGE